MCGLDADSARIDINIYAHICLMTFEYTPPAQLRSHITYNISICVVCFICCYNAQCSLWIPCVFVYWHTTILTERICESEMEERCGMSVAPHFGSSRNEPIHWSHNQVAGQLRTRTHLPLIGWFTIQPRWRSWERPLRRWRETVDVCKAAVVQDGIPTCGGHASYTRGIPTCGGAAMPSPLAVFNNLLQSFGASKRNALSTSAGGVLCQGGTPHKRQTINTVRGN